MIIKKYCTYILCCVFTSCGALNAKPKHTHIAPSISLQEGRASWYSIKTNGGTRTASGKKLVNHASTAAHKTLPLGTQVKVTNTNNGKSEVVLITDRGPYIRGRILDVTIGTAQRLGFFNAGTAPVRIEVVKHMK